MQLSSLKSSLRYILPALVVGLFAWGYTSAAGTTISVCVEHEGEMRMVGVGFTTKACKKGETLVSWNIQGPKGDKGDKGDPGTPSWNEARVASIEARLAALENQPPVTTCTAVVCDNFNSYVNGSIVGQGGWIDRVNGSNYQVQGTLVNEGSKALHFANSPQDSVITKLGTASPTGRQAVYIRTENRANWDDYNIGENVQVRLSKGSWDGPSKVSMALKKDGHASYYDPGLDKFVDFDTYTDNSWTLVEMEWRAVDKMARYRVNNGSWTSWVPFFAAASFTDFDDVGLDTIALGTGGVYFDTLQ